MLDLTHQAAEELRTLLDCEFANTELIFQKWSMTISNGKFTVTMHYPITKYPVGFHNP
jgi:hypothetical protein